MARAPVFRAGSNPGGTPAIGGVDPAAFGAGIGRALQNLGGSIERKEEAERQREREIAAADAGLVLAQNSGDIDVYSQQMRETAAAGGAGHTEQVLKRFDQNAGDALERITDERVRQVYEQRYATERARILSREDGWQRGQSVAHRVEQIDQTGTLLANQQASSPSPDGLEAALEQIETQVQAAGISEDLADGVVREQQRKVVAAWGNAMIDIDHQSLIDTIELGLFNPYLEPEDIDRLRSGAQVEGRRLEAAEKARQAEEAAAGRERISLFLKRISAGDTPSDEEFDEVAALATAIGDEGRLFDVQVQRQAVQINRETRTWTPSQFEAAINELQGLGDSRTTAQNIQLAQLERIRGERVSEFVNDPQAAAARRGNPAPPVNWAEPSRDELQRRASWAVGFARENGLVNVPYMSPEELRPLQERLEQGPAGMLEVARTLRTQWGAGIGGKIAQQLEPGDRTLQLMVGLPTTTQNYYGRGAEARKRNPELFDRTTANEIFAEYAEAIPLALRDPVFEAAANISAAIQDSTGNTTFREETFETAISFAMGGTGSRAGGISGGVGEWQGRNIWLPPGVSQSEFEARVARVSPEQLVAAAVDRSGQRTGRAPRYMGSDGKPGRALRVSEWRELQFETVSPGVFRVRGPIGGVLVDNEGAEWLFDVRRLP